MFSEERLIDRFVERMVAFCRREGLVRVGDSLLLAVSGGPDSMAMLVAFERLRRELRLALHVAHLNHKLRARASDEDAEFVREQARQRGIPILIESIDVAARRRESGGSLEALAREARMEFLERAATRVGADRIALAHHQDDLAETVLMRLLRGAGTTGLAGIRPMRDHRWIRPLLPFTKAEIVQFLETAGVPYRIDATNTDRRFTRNRIRHDLLPQLAEAYNPHIRRSLARTAAILSEEDAFLDELTQAAWERLARADGLILDLLVNQPVAIQRRLLRRWLIPRMPNGRTPTFEEIERARDFARDPTGTLALTRTLRLVVQEGLLIADRTKADGPRAAPEGSPQTLHVPGETESDALRCRIAASIVPSGQIDVARLPPDAAVFDWDAVPKPLVLRRWQRGDRFRPFGMNGMKRVGVYLSDAKVPTRRREHVAVVCGGDAVLWVVGLRADGRFPVTSSTRRALYLVVKPFCSEGSPT